MKARIYLRFAKSARKPFFTVAASGSPDANREPLRQANGSPKATAAFAVEIEIPESAFTQAERVLARGEIPADAVTVFEMVPVTHPDVQVEEGGDRE